MGGHRGLFVSHAQQTRPTAQEVHQDRSTVSHFTHKHMTCMWVMSVNEKRE